MKKIFTSILIMAGSILTAPATSAQNLTPVNTNFTGSYSYISPQYTQSNNSYLVLIDSKYGNGYTDFKIYDENLNEIKSITIQDIGGDNYTEVYLRELEYNPDAPKDEWISYRSSSYESLIQRIYDYLGGEDNTSIIESNGQTLYYPTDGSRSSYFFEYNTYGSMYPSKYYYIKSVVIDDDLIYDDKYELMEVDQSDCWVKTDRWSEPQIKDASYHPSYDGYCSIYPYNCNTSSDGNDMEFTQTLFNNDSDFEYIAPIYKLGQSSVYERDYTKEINYDYLMIGFAICNTSGNELQRILISQEGVSNIGFDLVTIGNKEYFAASYYDRNEETSKTIFYTIGANGTGLQQATEPISVRVAPTLISHDQSINVELDDIKGDGQLSVTDIAGRTVFSSKIQENGIYQIPARSLSRGMNIVTVQTQSGNKSTKVIVK